MPVAAPAVRFDHARSRSVVTRLRRALWAHRVQLWFVLLSLVAHAMLAYATTLWWSPRASLALWFSVYLLTAACLLRRCWADRPRPLALRVLDEALMVHWAAGMMALPLAAVLLLASLLISTSTTEGWWSSAEGRRLSCAASYAVTLLPAAWGVLVCRRWVRVTRVPVSMPRLPAAFEGYTIAHLSDLHLGSTDPASVARRWAVRANLEQPDAVAVTGDLVTRGTLFYADVGSVLGELQAPDGVFVSLGNHDRDDVEALSQILERARAVVLRNRWHAIRREGAMLVVAGLEATSEALAAALDEALAERPEGACTLLLSHYPSHFEEAAARGVDLVLSGHTHGGQVGLPLVGERHNVARWTGQRGRGVFTRGPATLFVSAGLGTTGVPLRLGVRPEITLLELRRAR